ncbi:hypothetical protein [Dactylosporangium sp. NPDC051541]|uniref:hypothetical protein n=1 Tax=Dactylosporangium sp. NPDC051541 TaxID=3363977 RepID=UPI0037985DB0
MRYGEIREMLESDDFGWRVLAEVDDAAEPPSPPVTGQDTPLAEGETPPADVRAAAIRALGDDPRRLVEAVERGLLPADEAQRMLEGAWGPQVRLGDFGEPR